MYVALQTNNPRKLGVLGQLGVAISGRIPCQVQAGEHNQVGLRWGQLLVWGVGRSAAA